MEGFTQWLQDASPGRIGLVLGGPVLLLLVVFAGLTGEDTSDLEEVVDEQPVAEAASEEPTEEPEATEELEPAEEPAPAAAADEPDILSEAACRHFRNVVGDVVDGVLTTEEIRTKMMEVREDAQFSEDPGIADSATALVRAVTQDDGEAFLQAVGEMSDACGELGL